ncbi:potassium channel protein [Sedimenticola selenatireducens]|uniref:BK channel n=1 Tax=Sedimenticola selenatireducens TaxID=191960 RepID=A0A557SD08_9GAMM|nr:potassium channel protein [Sedimenticola selenatireducens]TVO75300.1 potassium channel protein [Sedimenticola selenatireducens]TVT66847.1 MAG: potassium channel protein [Sedimenticola selenatireducens]
MSLSRAIIKHCYRLEDSPRYKRTKHFFYNLLENPQARIRPYFDIFMILLVLSSVFVLIYEVKEDLGLPGQIFELCAVVIFLTEYLLRFWLYNNIHRVFIEHYERAEFVNLPFSLGPPVKEVLQKKWDYMTTPLAIIDLLAIIPSYRPLRFLRIFLLFRLFKLFRYARSINEFVKVLSEKRFEFYTLAIFLAFVVFTAASAIYFFEARNAGGEIEHFFDGIYWAVVTISTVGYGDITPQTTEGRMITLVLIICGIGVISFTTSVIVSAFTEKMSELRDNRVFAELEKHKTKHIIICGFGRVGQVVAERLAASRDRFVVIDPDAEVIAYAKRLGYLGIQGSAEDSELLVQSGIQERAERILCLTGNDVMNVYITLTARDLNADIEIISRANNRASIRKLYQAGANHTVAPFKAVGAIAGEYIGQPVAFEAIHGILSGRKGISLETVTIRPDSCLIGRPISDVDFVSYKLILFGVISHLDRVPDQDTVAYDLKWNRIHFNPKAGFRLSANDLLVLIGHEYSITHFKDRLESGGL